MLDGAVVRQWVKCGKAGCKCACGERHTAYYREAWHDGRPRKYYIRRADVEATRKACAAYRQMQVELMQGRADYRALMSRSRELIRFLNGARKAGLLRRGEI
jgi:hypothetical protein